MVAGFLLSQMQNTFLRRLRTNISLVGEAVADQISLFMKTVFCRLSKPGRQRWSKQMAASSSMVCSLIPHRDTVSVTCPSAQDPPAKRLCSAAMSCIFRYKCIVRTGVLFSALPLNGGASRAFGHSSARLNGAPYFSARTSPEARPDWSNAIATGSVGAGFEVHRTDAINAFSDLAGLGHWVTPRSCPINCLT